MVKAVIFDFGRVFIFPKDEGYFGSLNDLHKVLSESPNYNFSDHFVFNNELMDFIKEEKEMKHFECYLFAKGKIIATEDCRKFFNNRFLEIFSTDILKLKKNQPLAYLSLSEIIDIDPSQILYVDDCRENTVAAENAGLQTITFRNNIQFETEFRGYI